MTIITLKNLATFYYKIYHKIKYYQRLLNLHLLSKYKFDEWLFCEKLYTFDKISKNNKSIFNNGKFLYKFDTYVSQVIPIIHVTE